MTSCAVDDSRSQVGGQTHAKTTSPIPALTEAITAAEQASCPSPDGIGNPSGEAETRLGRLDGTGLRTFCPVRVLFESLRVPRQIWV